MPHQIQHLFLALLCITGISQYVNAQTPLQDAGTNYLKKRADALMTITGYSLTPDVTTGNLKINSGNADKADLQMTSLGAETELALIFRFTLRELSL
jgi:hypothetical protein